ncbi:unnamed protein product [Paramecium primaurelia]|uniref:Uncharacterized protein n=1 Tax=Paramecium primaurelia TaxID=5886 RepID=A0A8S1MID4_PARPR|nr:unnamed protein product [Paramecium primaurelia]
MANTKWSQVDGNAIEQSLNIKPFLLINDFQAVAYSILGLQQQTQLNRTKKSKSKRQFSQTVIDPGAGFGVARLIPSLKQDHFWEYNICFEGGEVGYSSSNDLEIEYLQFLKKEIRFGLDSCRKAMEGQAIPYIYTFLKERLGILN